MKYALIDSNGLIQNLIVHNPSSSYTPPSGLAIASVNDWLHVGQHITDAAPTSTPLTGNDLIHAQLLALENAVTPRMLQEHAVGSTNVINNVSSPYNGMTATQAISAIVAQKDSLRAQLT